MSSSIQYNVTLRLPALYSDRSESCWKFFNGNLSLVKARDIFPCWDA